jgi:predicted aconitase with swiveling domain
MREFVLRAGRGLGAGASGIALVTSDNFSARYDLDRKRGVFSRPEHKLFGESYVGKILVVNTAKGGVATSWMLGEMVALGKAPLALLFNDTNPIMAQAAAFAGLTLFDRFDVDITTGIRTGDHVELDPVGRIVCVRRTDEAAELMVNEDPVATALRMR